MSINQQKPKYVQHYGVRAFTPHTCSQPNNIKMGLLHLLPWTKHTLKFRRVLGTSQDSLGLGLGVQLCHLGPAPAWARRIRPSFGWSVSCTLRMNLHWPQSANQSPFEQITTLWSRKRPHCNVTESSPSRRQRHPWMLSLEMRSPD